MIMIVVMLVLRRSQASALSQQGKMMYKCKGAIPYSNQKPEAVTDGCMPDGVSNMYTYFY